MDDLDRGAYITLQQTILRRFPPGAEREQWLAWLRATTRTLKLAGMDPHDDDGVQITGAMLRHALRQRKACSCWKDDRDPECAGLWPGICPYRAYSLHRRLTGDFANSEWWEYQLGLRETYTGEPPDPRQFDEMAAPSDSYRRQ